MFGYPDGMEPTLGMLPGVPPSYYYPESQPFQEPTQGFAVNPYWTAPPAPGYLPPPMMPQMPMPQAPQFSQMPPPNVSGYNKVSGPAPQQRGLGGPMAQNAQQPNPILDAQQQARPQIGNAGGASQLPMPGGGSSDAQQFAQNITSPLDDPAMALMTAMKQTRGQAAGNPLDLFGKYLLRGAQGLGLAFKMGHANDQVGSPATTNPGQAFGDFLRAALAGGDIFGTLNQAAGGLGGLVQGIRGLGNNDNALQTQPYLQELADILTSGNGQGTSAALASLLGPAMTQGGLRGLTEGLDTARQNALRSWAAGDITDPNRDLWSYLLGS